MEQDTLPMHSSLALAMNNHPRHQPNTASDVHAMGNLKHWRHPPPFILWEVSVGVERLSFFLKSENAKCQRNTWSSGIILSMDDHSSKGYTPIFFFFNLVLNWQFCHWGAVSHLYSATRYNFKHTSPPSTDRGQHSMKILKLQVNYKML